MPSRKFKVSFRRKSKSRNKKFIKKYRSTTDEYNRVLEQLETNEPQITSVKIQHIFDSDKMKNILDKFQNLPKLKKLIINNNNLQVNGIHFLSQIMKNPNFCSSLTYLDVSKNNIKDLGFAYLIDSLIHNPPPLEHLDVSENNIQNPGMIVFANRIHHKMFQNLTTLNIAFNYIGHVGFEAFIKAVDLLAFDFHTTINYNAPIIEYLKETEEVRVEFQSYDRDLNDTIDDNSHVKFPKLKKLNIMENNYADPHINDFAEAIKRNFLGFLEILSISRYQLTEYLEQICEKKKIRLEIINT
jgi:Leucine-rich repeat (LRR) protein